MTPFAKVIAGNDTGAGNLDFLCRRAGGVVKTDDDSPSFPSFEEEDIC